MSYSSFCVYRVSLTAYVIQQQPTDLAHSRVGGELGPASNIKMLSEAMKLADVHLIQAWEHVGLPLERCEQISKAVHRH